MTGAPRGRILIIDDERDLLGMLEFGLSLRGYEVLLAASGEQGLAIARSQPVDLVICDLKMPGMDGGTAVHLLRQEFPSLAIIIATGSLSSEVPRAYQQGEADDLIHKPFGLGELERVIERVRAGRRVPQAG